MTTAQAAAIIGRWAVGSSKKMFFRWANICSDSVCLVFETKDKAVTEEFKTPQEAVQFIRKFQ